MFYPSVETISPNTLISVTEVPTLESLNNAIMNVNIGQRWKKRTVFTHWLFSRPLLLVGKKPQNEQSSRAPAVLHTCGESSRAVQRMECTCKSNVVFYNTAHIRIATWFQIAYCYDKDISNHLKEGTSKCLY